MKNILSFAIFVCLVSSCKKCYDCRIVQTSPPEPGVQFQSSIKYIEFCGTKKQLDRFVKDTESDNLVTIGSKVYEYNVYADCN